MCIKRGRDVGDDCCELIEPIPESKPVEDQRQAVKAHVDGCALIEPIAELKHMLWLKDDFTTLCQLIEPIVELKFTEVKLLD